MRNSKVVSITLPPNMAAEAEELAKQENRIQRSVIGGRRFLAPLPGLAGFRSRPSAHALGYLLAPLPS
jgi:hypothetical protein